MDFIQAKDLILQGMAMGMVGWLVYEIRRTRESVEQLNIKIAVVIRDIDDHGHRIEKLEDHYGQASL
jgi:hypothetical protein